MEILKFLENIRNPILDTFFSLLTYLGDETAFIAVALIVFWCASKKYGYYILGVGFAGTAVNQFLKLSFRVPRPWVKDPSFTIVESAREGATGYSFPSGHTQTAIGLYGGVFAIAKNKALKILMIVLCVLVPFSRTYLGVHTPLDVLVSVGVSLFFVIVMKPIVDITDEKPCLMQVYLILVMAFAVILTIFAEFSKFPADIDAENLASGVKKAYTLLGCTIGLVIANPIERRYINFTVSGKWYTQIIKVVLGLGILLLIKTFIKIPLDAIFGDLAVKHAVRYFIMVVFGVLVWPLTFPFVKKLEKKSN